MDTRPERLRDKRLARRLLGQGLCLLAREGPPVLYLLAEKLVMPDPDVSLVDRMGADTGLATFAALQKHARRQRRPGKDHKKGQVGGRRPRSEWEKTLARHADGGYLTALLNDRLPGASQLDEAARKKVGLTPAQFPHFARQVRPRGTGEALYECFLRARWPGLQVALVVLRQHNTFSLTSHQWDQLMLEGVLFGSAGFHIGWCEVGQHRYVQDDKHLKHDCRLHRTEGRSARRAVRKSNKTTGTP